MKLSAMHASAYAIAAARLNLTSKRGMYQLLSADFVYDENYNAYMIEINNKADLNIQNIMT